jgi:aldehyde reductase
MSTTVTLATGCKMPLMGLGTLLAGSEELKNAVETAIDIGYRHIDTAFAYFNEKDIGEALKKVISSGKVKRSDLFITTKLHVQFLHKEDVMPKIKEQLKDLQLDYVDLYLVHGCLGVQKMDGNPFPMKDGKALFDVVDHMETWSAMEEVYKAGLAKNIGLSNYSLSQLKNVCEKATIKPHMLQCECHIYWPQTELYEFCKANNIGMTSYGTMGSPGKKGHGFQDESQPVLMEDPVVVKLTKKYNKSGAQILLRWAVQRNICVIPKSTNAQRLKDNFNIFDFTLSDADFKELSDIKIRRRMYNVSMYHGHPQFPADDF